MPIAAPRTRADRLDLLARMIGDRPGVTAGEIARDLGLSVRSVFRDLDSLRERGYPIEGARGRGGGLRLHGAWGLGKVLLSRDEALCTLLGLAIAEQLGLPMFASELGRARRKIADAFPTRERRRIAPLRERIFIGPAASPAVRSSYVEPAAAPTRRIQTAFVDERIVRAEYVNEGGQRSSRRLEPHALIINWPAWYLMAYDHLRGEPRTFRLVRISDVKATRAARTVPVPPTEQVLALLDDAVSRLNPLLEATVWVADGRAAELRAMARSATPAQRFGRSGADLGLAAPLGELSALVAAQGPDAVVLEPAELRVRVVSILSAAEEAVR